MSCMITHIDKFFHNSPGAARCLGTPHPTGKNKEEDLSSPLPPVRYVRSLHLKTSFLHPTPTPSGHIPQAAP